MQDKKTIIKSIIAAVFIIGVLVTIFVIFNRQRFKTYTSYEIKNELEIRSFDTSIYNAYERLAISTVNGAKGIDGSGKLIWEASFGFENPEVVCCEKVSAIADIGGEDVYVISESGLPYTYKVSFPLVKVCVARQGVTAVLLNNESKDLIQVYDLEGDLKVEIGTSTKVDGFPVDIALSPDGRKLAAFYVSFVGDQIVSKVTFYNFDSVGQNYIENIVGYRSFEDELVYDISFLGDDYVGIILDDRFIVYKMKEIPELICEQNYSEIDKTVFSTVAPKSEPVTIYSNLRDIAMSESEIIVVTEKEGIQKLHFYSLSGQELKVIDNIPAYNKLYAYGDEVVLLSEQNIIIYRKNGTVKFSGSFDRKIETVGFGGGNKYFIVDSAKVQTIVLSDNTKE